MYLEVLFTFFWLLPSLCSSYELFKVRILFLGCVYLFISFNNKKEEVINDDDTEVATIQPRQLCFYKEKKTSRGLYDVSWIKMNLSGEKVTGEFNYLPAEKDKKVGSFEGTVGAVDQMAMSRTADVWWNSMAEGMQNKEQLRIVFGEGNAQAGFGEMVDRGDGVYVYKDVSKLTYGEIMTDVSCDDISDRVAVEKYIRENIQTLAVSKVVLGGTWYVTMVHIDPSLKTGVMEYEDGHIQESANFSYAWSNGFLIVTDIVKNK